MAFGFGQSQGFGNSAFGNNNNNSGFGGNSGSSLFGGNANSGGSLFGSRSPFSQPSSNVFGQPSGFGQQQQSGGVFGGGSGGGGTFGQSAFGQPSSFGQSSPSLFAQSQPAFGGGGAFGNTSAFGNHNAFGGQSQSTLGGGGLGGGGAFGQSSSGIFGGQPSSSGFGSFGQSNPGSFGGNSGSSLFGSQSGGRFGWGQSASSASGFGGGSVGSGGGGGGGFGSFGSGFGGQQDIGTRGIKWELTRDFENGASSTYYCIAMMPKFRNSKSLEELRLEDYMHNAGQGGALQSAPGAVPAQSPFGGAQSQSGFGAGSSVFGNSAGNTAFGQSSSSFFGGASGSSFGGFGQSTPTGFNSAGTFGNSGGFGNAEGLGNSGGFGQKTSGFGQTPSFGGSGFGGNTAIGSTGGFGQTASAFGSAPGFGSGGSGFGNVGGFGQASTPAFGNNPGVLGGNTAFGGASSAQPAGALPFGGSAQPTFGFGSTASTPAFGAGAGAGTGSTFGSFGSQGTLGQSHSGFGVGSSTLSLGSSPPMFGQPSTGFGSTFGGAVQNPSAGGNMFGGSTTLLQQNKLDLVPHSGIIPNQGSFMNHPQPQQISYGSILYQQQRIDAEVQKQLAIERAKRDQEENEKRPKKQASIIVLPPPTMQEIATNRRRMSTYGGGYSNRMTRTRGTVTGYVTGAGLRVPMDEKRRLEELVAGTSPNAKNKFAFFTADRFLGVNEDSPYSLTEKGRRRLDVNGKTNGSTLNGISYKQENIAENGIRNVKSVRPRSLHKNEIHDSSFLQDANDNKIASRTNLANETHDSHGKLVRRKIHVADAAPVSNAIDKQTVVSESPTFNKDRSGLAASREKFMWSAKRPSSWSKSLNFDDDDQLDQDKYLPYVSREGYYIRPSVAELGALSMMDLQHVGNFTVGRVGFGEVTWTDPTDVRGLNIDVCVQIERGEVAVFPERLAQQLDAPADVKLLGMFKRSKRSGGMSQEATAKYVKKLQRFCVDSRIEFVDYDAKSGSWRFKVPGF